MEEEIFYRIDAVLFGNYKSDEIKRVSVKDIYSPLAFDKMNRPMKNGLYDPSMGVSPYDKFSRCVTCGNEGLNCPGHFGHIELILPVYNPFLINQIFKLLRSKCFSCHKIKLPKIKTEKYITMLSLAKKGFLIEARDYNNLADNYYLKEKKNPSNNDAHSESTKKDSGFFTLSEEDKRKSSSESTNKNSMKQMNKKIIKEVRRKKEEIENLLTDESKFDSNKVGDTNSTIKSL